MPHSISLARVLLVFVGALLFSTVLLHNLSAIGWKRLDMVALILAFFGLFPATFDSQQWFDNGERNSTKRLAEQNSLFTVRLFDDRLEEQCSGIDTNQQVEKDSICGWLKDQQANFRGNAEQLRPIAIEPLRKFPQGAEPLASEMTKVAIWYNSSANVWNDLNNKPEHELTFGEGMSNLVKSLSAIFGPYSLAIALAVKLTQIREEIAEERRKTKVIVAQS